MKRLIPLVALLAVFAVGCDSNDDDGVSVNGTITNVTDLGVDDATITFSTGAARGASVADFTANTDTDGAFSAEIPEGTYTVTISAPGYNDETFSYTTGSGPISQQMLGPAIVTGGIVSSQTGSGFANARVAFTRGEGGNVSQSEDEIDLQVFTEDDGSFRIEGAPTGTFLCVITAEGFLPQVVPNVNFQEGDTNLPTGITIVEAPPEGAFRIILSWGEAPRDLDSHLTGPTGNEDERGHIYFSDRNVEGLGDLDRDDTSGFGPETITVTPDTDGMYRYSVFNYTTQTASGSQGIAGEIPNSSAARIEVYSEDELVRTYTAPASTPGNTWRVFEMQVSGDNITINDINTYVTADGSGDIDVFRVPPGEKAPMSPSGL